MFGISKKTVINASLATLASIAVSLSAALIVVPMLGGTPDGPGFWMSVACPLLIAWPASAYQFNQNEKIRTARDQVAALHLELERMHKELMIAHASLQQKSRIDGMTGALNRETFFALLDSAGADGRLSALLLADADHFKAINDEFGHQCGDEALRSIAQAISSSLRPQDFWGRIGGEEFAIYLDGANEGTAHLIAEMIRLAVDAIDLHVDGKKVPISLSIGGVCSDAAFETKTIVAEADRRLYHAKHTGRNKVVINPGPANSAAA